MNAENELRSAVSSLARGKKGLGSAITAKGRLQCLFRVLVGKQPAGAWFVARQESGGIFVFSS